MAVVIRFPGRKRKPDAGFKRSTAAVAEKWIGEMYRVLGVKKRIIHKAKPEGEAV